MRGLIVIFEKETKYTYKDNVYSVRVMDLSWDILKKERRLDLWTINRHLKQLIFKRDITWLESEPVHRIVATAFSCEAPCKSHVVDHINTNRQNNRPENLRWVTRLENIVLNDITRRKLELLCGCSIEEILSDLSTRAHWWWCITWRIL